MWFWKVPFLRFGVVLLLVPVQRWDLHNSNLGGGCLLMWELIWKKVGPQTSSHTMMLLMKPFMESLVLLRSKTLNRSWMVQQKCGITPRFSISKILAFCSRALKIRLQIFWHVATFLAIWSPSMLERYYKSILSVPKSIWNSSLSESVN